MSEANRVTQVRAGQEAESKGGKRKAVIKRNKAGESRRQPGAKDPKVIESIRQRAYLLFLAAGCELGHDVEHWLEAERQITG